MRLACIVFVFFCGIVTRAYGQQTSNKCEKVVKQLVGSWTAYKIITEINGSEVVSKHNAFKKDTLSLYADSTFRIATEEPKMFKGMWRVEDKGTLLVLIIQEAVPQLQTEMPVWKFPIKSNSKDKLVILRSLEIRLGKKVISYDSSSYNTRIFYRRIKE